jgi:hypothetical protein
MRAPTPMMVAALATCSLFQSPDGGEAAVRWAGLPGGGGGGGAEHGHAAGGGAADHAAEQAAAGQQRDGDGGADPGDEAAHRCTAGLRAGALRGRVWVSSVVGRSVVGVLLRFIGSSFDAGGVADAAAWDGPARGVGGRCGGADAG